MVVYVMVAY